MHHNFKNEWIGSIARKLENYERPIKFDLTGEDAMSRLFLGLSDSCIDNISLIFTETLQKTIKKITNGKYKVNKERILATNKVINRTIHFR